MSRLSGAYDRFKDAKWFGHTVSTLIVGGAGGIGSWLSLFLVRAKFKALIYDFDRFEEHNIGGQLVKVSQISDPKVSAVGELVTELTGDKFGIIPRNEEYTDESPAGPYMFSAFDNMKARKVMFNKWLQHVVNTKSWGKAVFIDGRLSAESFEIYCVQTEEQAKIYSEKYLFDDKESSETLCTLKQTSHVAAMIAGYMVSYFTNYIANRYSIKRVFHVPFKSVHFLQLGIHKIEKE